MPNESDPTGRGPQDPGAKFDAGKAPIAQGVLQYFPRAIIAVSLVSLHGASKYSWAGWRDTPDGFNRYSNALGRHLVAEAIEGLVDARSGSLHAAHVAWNSMARLEILLLSLGPKALEGVQGVPFASDDPPQGAVPRPVASLPQHAPKGRVT